MFQLELTKKLAANGFNAMVLGVIEKDAFSTAAIRQQNAGHDLTVDQLIKDANQLLPQSLAEGTRLFFATQHQIHDDAFDNTRDLGDFISKRAAHLEQRAVEDMDFSTTPGQWIDSLADLADGYSYVIEAAQTLEAKGLIAMRRSAELSAITTRPNDDTEFAKAQLFDKAMAFFQERAETAKSQLRESYR